ncbi:MAG: leucine-rich repeat protein, partial [Bacteroidales bacterium]|nr:leucine-rich repeat protein [Bacteroidales bacterium]
NPFEHCESLVSFTGDSPLVADEGRCLINAEGTLFSYAPAAVANRYVVPSNVKRISFGAFKCATFQSVVIPASVETISGYTFDDCPNLTTIEIRGGGRNLRIGLGMIRNCPQLRRINMASAVPPFFMSTPNSMEWDIPETCQIAIPGAGSCTYDSSEYPSWRQLRDHFFYYQADNEIWYHYANNSVSATLNSSNDFGAQSTNDFVMFIDRSQIGSYVPFPASIEPDSRIVIAVAEFDGIVTKIPEDVFSSQYFSNQLALDWVSLPGQVTTIGNRAFKGNSSLPSFPVCANNVLTTIGDEAFMDCSSMVNGGTGSYAVSLPSSVTTIGARAFKNCSSIQRAYATGATSIGNAAFESCSNLLFSRLGNGLTEIADSVFYRCSKLEGVFLSNPSSVTSIGVASFQNASMLKTVGSESNVGKVNMPGVTEVKDYAFYNCSNIENVQMANLLTVNESSFSGLADVTFSLPKLETINGWYSFGSVVTDHLYLPSLKNAGSACFIFGYSKINKITFGPGLESLPYDSGLWGFCFNNVTSTVHIYFWGTTPPVIGPNTFRSDYNDPSVLADIRFHVLGGYKEVYKSALHNASSLYDNYYSKIYDDIEDPN